jgi:hypothetical protein
MNNGSKPAVTKAQQKIIDALRETNAYMVPPADSPGERTGYVTTGGLKGWICPVNLSTFKVLESKSIISRNFQGDYYRLSNELLKALEP